MTTNTSPEGNETKSYSNTRGWVLREEENGLLTKNVYDGNGQVVVTTTGDAGGTVSSSVVEVHDASGNVTATIDNPVIDGNTYSTGADSIVTMAGYDNLGNQTSSTDAMGNTTICKYDTQSRLKSVTTPNGTEQSYTYDILEEDQNTSVMTEYANGAVSKEYTDEKGNLAKITDFGKEGDTPLTTLYEYDKKGNLTKETFGNGEYKIYFYDGRDRLLTTTYYNEEKAAELITEYTYDTADRMLSMADYEVSGETKALYHYQAWSYDGFGQVTSYAQYHGSSIPTGETLENVTIRYGYNADGMLISVTYPKAENGIKGLRFVYGYQTDAGEAYEEHKNTWLTQILAVDDNGDRKLLRAYAYSADGKVTGIKDYRNFQNGSTQDYILRTYTYDEHDRVAKIAYVDSKAPDSVKESYAYTYDKNSNILTETIKNHSLTDGYHTYPYL